MSADMTIDSELVRRIIDNYEERLEMVREHNQKLMCEVYDQKVLLKNKDMLIDKLQSDVTDLNDQLAAEYKIFEKENSELEEQNKLLIYELNQRNELIRSLKADMESLRDERRTAHHFWATEVMKGMHLEDLEKL